MWTDSWDWRRSNVLGERDRERLELPREADLLPPLLLLLLLHRLRDAVRVRPCGEDTDGEREWYSGRLRGLGVRDLDRDWSL